MIIHARAVFPIIIEKYYYTRNIQANKQISLVIIIRVTQSKLGKEYYKTHKIIHIIG